MMLYTFVNFDNLVNENNEIEAPEGLKDLLVELIDNGYIEDLFGTWWETGNDEEDEWLKEKGIEVKTMKEIVDTDPDAKFGFSYGYPEKRLDVTNASGYIEDKGVGYEDYGVTAEDFGIEEDDYYETSSTLDDNDWDETDDPLYGYGEDDFLESKKTSSKRIYESEEDDEEDDLDETVLREDAFTTDIVYVTPHDDPSWYDENGNPAFEPDAYPEIAYATACELQKIADPIFIDYSDGDAESGMCAPEPTGIFKMTVAELKTAIENGNLVEDDIDVYTEYDPETQTVIETSKIEDVLSLVFDAVEPLTEVSTKGYCEVSIKAPSGKLYPVNDKSGNPLTCTPDEKSKLEVLAKINKERGKNYTLDQLVFSDIKKK